MRRLAAVLRGETREGVLIGCRAFDLETIKSMRKAVPGATVNDVLLTICAGGLREFLEEQDALPGAPMKAGCPINIRTEGEAAAGGNMISAMIVNLHTDIADPVKRLKAIAASSAASKQRAAQRGDRKILDIAAIVPAQAQALLGHAVGLAARRMKKAMQFNCSISNLPGPQIDLRMLGGKLVSIGAAMPIRDALTRGKVLVVPSRAESMPYVVLEAIAAGKTVIASDVGGIPEILGADSPALVTADGIGPLASAMAGAVLDPLSLASAMPDMTAFRKRFSARAMATRIVEIYRTSRDDAPVSLQQPVPVL